MSKCERSRLTTMHRIISSITDVSWFFCLFHSLIIKWLLTHCLNWPAEKTHQFITGNISTKWLKSKLSSNKLLFDSDLLEYLLPPSTFLSPQSCLFHLSQYYFPSKCKFFIVYLFLSACGWNNIISFHLFFRFQDLAEGEALVMLYLYFGAKQNAMGVIHLGSL